MIKVRRTYRYVVEDMDRHGNVRVYLRRPGLAKIRMREKPGTPAFDIEYQRALAGEIVPAKPPRVVVVQGSLRALCIAYFGSAEVQRLDRRTVHVRRLIMDHLCERFGTCRVDELEARHVRAMRDLKPDRPEAGNAIVKALRAVLRFGVETGHLSQNVAKDVAYIRSGGEGFHSWSPSEVAQFERAFPIGTKARLAFDLLLCTGQRRSDVVRLGWHHLHGDTITFTQVKNGRLKPVTLSLPLLPELWESLIATVGDERGPAFLLSEHGKPFTAESFGNRFRKWCNEAGLPHCSSHGLRKAAAKRLAEHGCSIHEIAAVTGHRSLKEVQRYTLGADQIRLARSAFKRLPNTLLDSKLSHSTDKLRAWDKKAGQATENKGEEKCMVPKTGIEPVTLRFSVACSTN